MVSVYISNEKIQALHADNKNGVLTVRRVISLPLPDGCVLNGKLLDKMPIEEQLRRLVQDAGFPKEKIRIAADSGAVGTKLLTMPNLRSRKYIDKLISEAFTETGDAVYDYKILGKLPDGSVEVLACRADISFVEDYADVFSSAGFKISGIDLGICGIIRLVEFCGMLKASSFALVAADEKNVSQYLFIDGQYRFGGHERLFSDRDTSEYAQEIIKALSATVLFGNEISNVLFCGVSENELNLIRKGIGKAIRCAAFPQQPEVIFENGERLSDCIFTIGALL